MGSVAKVRGLQRISWHGARGRVADCAPRGCGLRRGGGLGRSLGAEVPRIGRVVVVGRLPAKMSAQTRTPVGSPRLVALSAHAEDFPLDPSVRQFCGEYGFTELGMYHDAGLGEMVVRAFVSGDGKVNARFFHLPGRVEPVVEFASAFANGECLVTTTAPVTGNAAAWIDLLAVVADLQEVALQHGARLAVAEARAAVEAVPVRNLNDHFELCGRVEFEYDFSGVFPGATLGAKPAADAVWYYSVAGERRGPVRLAEIKLLLRSGQLLPRRDMAWMPDFPDWLQIAEIAELAGVLPAAEAAAVAGPPKPPRVVSGGASGVAAAAPAVPVVPDDVWSDDERELSFGQMMRNRDDPGIGRLAFWASTMIFIPGLAVLAFVAARHFLNDPQVGLWAVLGICFFGTIAAIVARLRNVGMSGAWLFGLLVPPLCLWVAFRLGACPGGYAEHRRLGLAGIFFTLVLVVALVINLSAVAFIYLKGVPPQWRGQFTELREKLPGAGDER